MNVDYLNKMVGRLILFASLLLAIAGCENQQKPEKHLFILSGQSNMARLDPNVSFTPTVSTALGNNNIIVVKDALGGQPIRYWYKAWQPAKGDSPKASAYLYHRLLNKLQPIIKAHTLTSITLIWMQGETDAQEQHGEVYQASLKGLFDQLANDLKRDDIHFVIGRLSDFDLNNTQFKHWSLVRNAQTNIANTYPNSLLINTDDLNDGVNAKGETIINDLHYSVEGYKTLGKRFATSAIALINQQGQPAQPTLVD